jgi:hypothetical protein
MNVKTLTKVADVTGFEPVANLLIEGQIVADSSGNLSIAIFRGQILCSGTNIDPDQLLAGFGSLSLASVYPLKPNSDT